MSEWKVVFNRPNWELKTMRQTSAPAAMEIEAGDVEDRLEQTGALESLLLSATASSSGTMMVSGTLTSTKSRVWPRSRQKIE